MKKQLFAVIASLLLLTSCSNAPIYSLYLSKPIANISVEGGKDVINVESNAPWEIILDEEQYPWITVNIVNSGIVLGEFEIIVDAKNTSGAKKEGIVLVKNGDNIRQVDVIQGFLALTQSQIIGTWTVTETSVPVLNGAQFTFNLDYSCVANMPSMPGMQAGPINKTYTLTGSLITIVNDRPIEIAVTKISETSMEASVGNYNVVLTKN